MTTDETLNDIAQELDTEDYVSSEDEDFNPNAPTTAELEDNENSATSGSSSDSEVDGSKDATSARQKRNKAASSTRLKKKTKAVVVDLSDNSGDEAIVQRGKRKRVAVGSATKSKSESEDEDFDADDDGGEGGLIKTRAQRAREQVEKAPRITTEAATVDVDAVWESLNSDGPAFTAPPPITTAISTANATTTGVASASVQTSTIVQAPEGVSSSSTKATTNEVIPKSMTREQVQVKHGMITIKRTYKFAGEVVTEEKDVPAESAEAKAYLASLPSLLATSNTTTKKPLRKVMKRKSMFDTAAGAAKPTKLTTLEKSRLDWAGYVDKEGIGDELERQKRGGAGYLDREAFLGRVSERTAGNAKPAEGRR